jgi:hypothetical protein
VKKYLQITAGLAIGAFLLWFLFKDTDWVKVWRAFQEARTGWLFVGLVAILISFVIRIWRWSYIVNPVIHVPFWQLFSATQIGFLGNFVLPARIGEVIRALVLSKSRDIPFPKTMAFVAVDRLTDLFGLVYVFLVTLLVFRPNSDVYLPEDMKALYSGAISKEMVQGSLFVATAALIAGVAFLMLLIARKKFFLALSDSFFALFSKRLGHFVRKLFLNFAEGMQVLLSFKDLLKASLVSLLLWTFFAISQYAVFKAFDLSVPWFAPFVVLSLLSVFISIPGPPGFIGPFHVGVVGGLILVNNALDLDSLRAVAIVAHLFNLVPVVLIGIVCLSFEKIGLRQLAAEGDTLTVHENAAASTPSADFPDPAAK